MEGQDASMMRQSGLIVLSHLGPDGIDRMDEESGQVQEGPAIAEPNIQQVLKHKADTSKGTSTSETGAKAK